MSTNINIRVDEELKNALQGYAKLENKTVSEIQDDKLIVLMLTFGHRSDV